MDYTFILSKNIYAMNLFGDLKESASIYVSDRKYTKFWNFMQSHKLVSIPLYKFAYCFDEKSLKNKSKNCIVLDTGVLKIYSINYLVYLKNKYNAKLVLLVLNSMHADSGNVKDVKSQIFSDIWDSILTFDKEDAKEYNWIYFGLNYFSTPKKIRKDLQVDTDVYFVGGLKGNRDNLIYNTFKTLNDNCEKVTFDIFCFNKEMLENVKYPDKIRYYTEWKNYDEIQEEILKSNCILEILQENQHTQSVRYFEAIYYNKKLLTNNPDIVNLPYYDNRYMKYFSKPEDIDLEWIKKKEKIDYNYKGDFSPLKLLEIIEKNL